MAMDFFEHQAVARKKTGLLVFLFGAAVVAIILGTYLVIAGVLVSSQDEGGEISLWEPTLLLPVTLAVLVVVTVGCLYRMAGLRSGGKSVAELMGARRVDPGSADADERRLLNVVEEMAIASGTPVPPVFVMDDEQGINAFAAGYEPGDAVVAVTRGTLEELDRDELQGVIAHEFSHILNGDMRLNIRLMGFLHGITLIGMIGWMILRSGSYGGGRSRSGKRDGNQLIIIGLGLWILGALGTFFANLIKAAVSRQREFLADSSAVQFTRNPGGIGGALRKIGGLEEGSRIYNPHGVEVGHMLFGAGTRSWLGQLGATHPPIEERLKRIHGSTLGLKRGTARAARSGKAATQEVAGAPAAAAATAGFAGPVSGAAATATAASDDAPLASAVESIGQPDERQVEYARELIAELPERLVEAVRNAYGARAVIYALLLAGDEATRSRQLDGLARNADPAVYEETLHLFAATGRVDPRARLPLLDLAMPALRDLSPRQYRDFASNVGALVRAIETPSVFHWTLGTVLRKHLFRQFERERPRAVVHTTLARLRKPSSALLSTLAHEGHDNAHQATAAFQAGALHTGLAGLEQLPPAETTLEHLADALRTLDTAAPHLKKRLLEACARTISFDHTVTLEEGELFRAIADTLGCPVPPLLPGQPLA